MVQPGNTVATVSKPEPDVKSGAAGAESPQGGAGSYGDDVDAATQEAINDELITRLHNVDGSKGMHLLKVSKYPSKRDDKSSPVESQVIVTERDNKPIRVGAIVVNSAAVEGKGKITHWPVLKQHTNYLNALLASLNDSSPKSVHTFQATLRYPEDIVMAVIAPPNITKFSDESPTDVVHDKSLDYKIKVQRTKYHEGPAGPKKTLVQRFFERFTWKSVGEKEPETAKTSSDGKNNDNYVSVIGTGEYHVPIPSAPRLDDTPYGVANKNQHFRTLRSATLQSRSVTGSKRPAEGFQEAWKNFGIPAAVTLGSAGVVFGGTVLLAKSPRLKSFIGL